MNSCMYVRCSCTVAVGGIGLQCGYFSDDTDICAAAVIVGQVPQKELAECCRIIRNSAGLRRSGLIKATDV